jgi:hypothetical protein
MNNNAKKVLKEMVRECLMEILIGGLGDSVNESIKPRKQQTIASKNSNTKSAPTNVRSNVKKLHETVAMATDDDLMRSILMDTAQTTLQEQLRNEIPGYGYDPMEESQAQTDKGVDLNDLFKEASSNWATITNRISR